MVRGHQIDGASILKIMADVRPTYQTIRCHIPQMILACDRAESFDCSETKETSQASSLAAEANQASPPRVAILH
jgi:hypothetical protein